jgi:hypothetical protein
MCGGISQRWRRTKQIHGNLNVDHSLAQKVILRHLQLLADL